MPGSLKKKKEKKKRLWHRCFPVIRSTLIINLIQNQINFDSQLVTPEAATRNDL